MPTEIVEISHVIEDGMPSYPGLPRPLLELHIDHEGSRDSYGDEAEFAIGRMELVGNVGTYLDSPYHRFRDGTDISQLPLDRLVDLPTVVIDARREASGGRRLDLVLRDRPLAGRAVLIRTDWDERWGQDTYWDPGPFLGAVTVQQLIHHRPALIGVDFWNVDDPDEPSRPVHTALLAAGIPIIEHLTALGSVAGDARSYFVPLAVRGAPSMPVRAFAMRWQEPVAS